MVFALAEASQTTYIRDRWEYTDYSGEKQYCIVAPTLPSSGNYSAYSIWGKYFYIIRVIVINYLKKKRNCHF